MSATSKARHTADDLERRRSIAFLNWAHAIDHFVLLIYPTVVIGLEVVYQRSYSETDRPFEHGFIAFGVFSPSGRVGSPTVGAAAT